MNVLSLFDGVSCGRVALTNLEADVKVYSACEVDKYAIGVSEKNYPDIVQLGDINNWSSWSLNFAKTDLILAGFPCQAWSIAGNQQGVNDIRGELVYRLLEIYAKVKQVNPNVKFLFENVQMKKEHLDFINSLFECGPIKINSTLVSGQTRVRNYWTNISDVVQPEDKNIHLKDILESGYVNRDKSYCIDACYYKGANLKQYLEKSRRQQVFEKPERVAHFNQGGRGDRIYSVCDKSVCLSALGGGRGAKTGLYPIDLPDGGYSTRKLTPIECERLQTLPDDYTKVGIIDGKEVIISNSQRYKMLGNGWTVAVIEHILKPFVISQQKS